MIVVVVSVLLHNAIQASIVSSSRSSDTYKYIDASLGQTTTTKKQKSMLDQCMEGGGAEGNKKKKKGRYHQQQEEISRKEGNP